MKSRNDGFSRLVIGVLACISLILFLSVLWVNVWENPTHQSERILFCANLYNNEDILPAFTNGLFELIEIIGKGNIFVSIFENGSFDGTQNLLLQLKRILDTWEVENHVIMGGIPFQNGIDNIEKLVIARNNALSPLYFSNHSFTGENMFTKIVFANDVVFQGKQVIELMNTNKGDFDFVCGMDFYRAFYDRFVSRDISGDIMSRWYPYSGDPDTQEAIRLGEPFKVYSCWNGLVVFSADPVISNGIGFRKNGNDECYSSECYLFCHDLHSHGHDKGYINPNVKVTYELQYKEYLTDILPEFNPILHWYNRISVYSGELPCPKIPMLCC